MENVIDLKRNLIFFESILDMPEDDIKSKYNLISCKGITDMVEKALFLGIMYALIALLFYNYYNLSASLDKIQHMLEISLINSEGK